MEDLKNIIKEIKGYKKEFNLTFTDDILLDCSTRIFISNNISNNKKINIKDRMEERKDYGNILKNKEPITKPQLYALKRLGYKGDLNITKQEAFQIIKKIKEE